MKRVFLSLSLSLLSLPAFGQILQPVIQGGQSAVVVLCGNSQSPTNTTGANENTNYNMSPCTPASNATVIEAHINVRGTAAGTLFAVIYADATSGCGGGLSHCATGTPLCKNETGVSAVLGDNAIPLSGCPTLTAGTMYWLGIATNSSTVTFGFNTSGCGSQHYEYFSITWSGTFSNPINKAGSNDGGSFCNVQYLKVTE